MDDVKREAVDVANELMGRYASLISGADPDSLRLLLQYAYFEGRDSGLRVSRKAYREAVETVLGKK